MEHLIDFSSSVKIMQQQISFKFWYNCNVFCGKYRASATLEGEELYIISDPVWWSWF